MKESGEERDRKVNFGLGEEEFGIVKEGNRVGEIDDIAIANINLCFVKVLYVFWMGIKGVRERDWKAREAVRIVGQSHSHHG